VLCISEIDKPLLFLKCLIQLISDIASILSYLHYQLLDTMTVVGLGVTGKSFFVYAQKFSAGLCIFPLQSSALLFCHTQSTAKYSYRKLSTEVSTIHSLVKNA
ncbi:hypothetical protein, partial [Ureibacillus thermosphaericus]|uniref:hypothetical protein n=1 Tax=Ureibacillus thermosphaericus TaxID=51173 RepID=UPI0030C98E43